MKKFNILILIFSIFLVSCSEIKRGLTGEKTLATDQFLVKKKKPLVLPPEFDQLPTPKNIEEKEINETENIKKIINIKNLKEQKKVKSNSLEESVLKKIKN